MTQENTQYYQDTAHQTGETGCGVVEFGAEVSGISTCQRSVKRPLAAAKSVPRFWESGSDGCT